jgi:hypothetical protein
VAAAEDKTLEDEVDGSLLWLLLLAAAAMCCFLICIGLLTLATTGFVIRQKRRTLYEVDSTIAAQVTLEEALLMEGGEGAPVGQLYDHNGSVLRSLSKNANPEYSDPDAFDDMELSDHFDRAEAEAAMPLEAARSRSMHVASGGGVYVNPAGVGDGAWIDARVFGGSSQGLNARGARSGNFINARAFDGERRGIAARGAQSGNFITAHAFDGDVKSLNVVGRNSMSINMVDVTTLRAEQETRRANGGNVRTLKTVQRNRGSINIQAISAEDLEKQAAAGRPVGQNPMFEKMRARKLMRGGATPAAVNLEGGLVNPMRAMMERKKQAKATARVEHARAMPPSSGNATSNPMRRRIAGEKSGTAAAATPRSLAFDRMADAVEQSAIAAGGLLRKSSQHLLPSEGTVVAEPPIAANSFNPMMQQMRIRSMQVDARVSEAERSLTANPMALHRAASAQRKLPIDPVSSSDGELLGEPGSSASRNKSALSPSSDLPAGWSAHAVEGDASKTFYHHAESDETMWVHPKHHVGLAPGWSAVAGDDGYVFFHHAETGETAWEKPRGAGASGSAGGGAELPAAASGAHVINVESGGEESREAEPPPAGWTAHSDDEGYTYFHNTTTGATVWERPEEEAGHVINVESGGEELREAEPPPAGWTAHSDDEGDTYFHNTATGATVWERPEGEAGSSPESDGASLPDGWVEVEHDDGSTFYHNAATSETVWERPAKAEVSIVAATAQC